MTKTHALYGLVLFSLQFAWSIQVVLGQRAYVIPQLTRPNDTRVLALGLTGVASRAGALAPVSNPAGLAETAGLDLSISHLFSRDVDDGIFHCNDCLNQDAFALGMSLPKNYAVGASFDYMDNGRHVMLPGLTGDSWVRQYQFSVAKRFQASNKLSLSIGGSSTYLHEKHFTDDETGWLFALGGRARLSNENSWLSVGFSVHNLGSDLNLDFGSGSSTDISPFKYFRGGVAAGIKDASQESGGMHPEVMATVEYQADLEAFDNWRILGAGIELGLFNLLWVRGGYVHDFDSDLFSSAFDGVTYGFAVKLPENLVGSVPASFELSYANGIETDALKAKVLAIAVAYRL